VNVLAGTAGGAQGGQHHSTGNVLPLTALPWGFNHWAPQTTNEQTAWWFDANADTFRGIRCTHQPSPWIGDYAFFVLRPYLGHGNDEWLGFTSYRVADALRPWAMDLSMGPYGVRVELTPTSHGAVLRVGFPSSVPIENRKICAWVPGGKKKDRDESRAKNGKPTGHCQAIGGGIDLQTRRFADGIPMGADFGLYARLEPQGDLHVEEDGSLGSPSCFEADTQYIPLDMDGQHRTQEVSALTCQLRCAGTPGCEHFTSWADGGCHISDSKSKREKAQDITTGPPHCPKDEKARQCCFVLGDNTEAVVRIGTSFISPTQALRALDKEIGDKSFETVRDEAQKAWRTQLSAVSVEDAGPPSATTLRRLEVFYTCLYRALLFPRRLDEFTPSGVQHWSPYNGKVQKGPGVTDNGFWDTFRTVYPLLALAYPRQLGEIIQGWLNAYLAGGWLPKWASPGYRDSMVGTFADVVISDAIIKNISGFDRSIAWQALRKDAFEHSGPKDTSRGKFGLKHYEDKGYIPVDVGINEACSRTLDFAFADAATAKAAAVLGEAATAKLLFDRSVRGLRALYDVKSGLMGHRLSSGGFNDEPAETWGDCFTEGSAWHHSFPPFNLEELELLHGGREPLLDKLRQLFTVPADFQVGSYRAEIHEMREMRMLGLGQYAHNNQPVHHLPFLFALLGDLVLAASAPMLNLDVCTLSNNQDNGEMGSWYVLSALGLYVAAPGASEDYVLASVPLFKRVHLRALDIRIEAPAAIQDAPIISKVWWRSRLVDEATLPYSVLRSGGTLFFEAIGDDKLGRVESSMRGIFHGAVKRARSVAKRIRGSVPSRSTDHPTEDHGLQRSEEALSTNACIAIIVATLIFVGWLNYSFAKCLARGYGDDGVMLRTVCRKVLSNAKKPD